MTQPPHEARIPLHAGDGRRSGPLTAACDNVLAYSLGQAHNEAAKASAGDFIDRGLVMLATMRQHGLLVIQQSDLAASRLSAPPAAPAEPVAWRYKLHPQGAWHLDDERPTHPENCFVIDPLYAASPGEPVGADTRPMSHLLSGALEAIEAGVHAPVLMNVEGLKENLRAAIRSLKEKP